MLAIGLVLWTAPASAQRGTPPSRRSLGELSAEVARTTQAYRDAVARSIPQHEASVREALAALEERRKLYKAGALPAAYVEQAERDLVAAEQELDDAQKALDDADRLLFQAALQQRLASLPALPRGGFEDRATLVRFNGPSPWSLKGVPALEQRFLAAFGRSLPISAFGQTKVHDRLDLDSPYGDRCRRAPRQRGGTLAHEGAAQRRHPVHRCPGRRSRRLHRRPRSRRPRIAAPDRR